MTSGPINPDPNIPPQHSVSIYGQSDAMDDFPVLKAFQQYIDAEQAKAQKRTTTLCLFFVVILALVIGVFVMLLLNISSRNNALNDQVLQFMMKDRERQAITVQTQAPGGESAALKALTDSMAEMQKQLSEQQMKMFAQQAKMFEEQAKAAEEKAKAAAAAQTPQTAPATDADRELKRKAEEVRLQKELALLKAEKERIAKEKEEMRQKKIEMQRRKLYPEYYAKKDAEEAGLADPEATPAKQPAPVTPKAAPLPRVRPAAPVATMDDVIGDDDDDELDSLLDIPPSSDKPISYFDDEDDEDDEDVPAPATKKPVKKPAVVAPRATTPSPAKSVSKAKESDADSVLRPTGTAQTSNWEIPLD